MPAFLATLSCTRSGTSMGLGKVGKERGEAKATKAMKMQVETQPGMRFCVENPVGPTESYCRGCFGRYLIVCMLQTAISYSAVKLNMFFFMFFPFIQSLQVFQVSQVSRSIQLDPVDRHSDIQISFQRDLECGLTLPLNLSELLVWGS